MNPCIIPCSTEAICFVFFFNWRCAAVWSIWRLGEMLFIICLVSCLPQPLQNCTGYISGQSQPSLPVCSASPALMRPNISNQTLCYIISLATTDLQDFAANTNVPDLKMTVCPSLSCTEPLCWLSSPAFSLLSRWTPKYLCVAVNKHNILLFYFLLFSLCYDYLPPEVNRWQIWFFFLLKVSGVQGEEKRGQHSCLQTCILPSLVMKKITRAYLLLRLNFKVNRSDTFTDHHAREGARNVLFFQISTFSQDWIPLRPVASFKSSEAEPHVHVHSVDNAIKKKKNIFTSHFSISHSTQAAGCSAHAQ